MLVNRLVAHAQQLRREAVSSGQPRKQLTGLYLHLHQVSFGVADEQGQWSGIDQLNDAGSEQLRSVVGPKVGVVARVRRLHAEGHACQAFQASVIGARSQYGTADTHGGVNAKLAQKHGRGHM